MSVTEVAPLHARFAISRRESPVIALFPDDVPILRFMDKLELHRLSTRERQVDIPVVCVLPAPAVLHEHRLIGVPLAQFLGAAGNIDRKFARCRYLPGAV